MATIHGSRFPDVKVENVDIVKYILDEPFHRPDDYAYYTDALTGETRTKRDIRKRVRSLAHGLRDLGVRERDVVAFFSPNSIDYAIICYAVIGCGAIVSPVSAALTALELQAQLSTSQARFLITHSALRPTALTAAKGTSVRTILQADGEGEVDALPTAQTLATSCPPMDLFTIDPAEAAERVAMISFSSGTSGAAKGVMLTHRNLVANTAQHYGMNNDVDVDYSIPTVCFLPMSHIYCFHSFLLHGPWIGRRLIVMSKFDLSVFLESAHKYRSIDLWVVPPVILLLVKSPLLEKYDLSRIQRVISAAAPLSRELAHALHLRFKRLYGASAHCIQAYGLTETSPLVCSLPFSEAGKSFSVGRIAPNTSLRFVNPDTMQDVPVHPDGSTDPGELWVNGPQVTKGYLNNEAANRTAFHFDADGTRWYRTGDVGFMDRHGYATLSDRIKEMIKYKGFQVTPSEIEGQLVEHPYIDDAGVVGRWVEEQATEVPVAFVVLRPGIQKTEQAVRDIHQWLNAKVANHKRLRGGLRIVEAIPRSASGKILRRQLRDLLKQPITAHL